MFMYWRRCRRIVTTVSVELTNHNVVYGGVTTLLTVKIFVTHSSTVAENLEQIAAITSRWTSTKGVLSGTFGDNRACKRIWICISNRPVSESESERQRARNGASESERDFSRERATIHMSESKRAKFRMRRDFSFYSALQWSSYVCSIYRTYGNPVSVRFPLFQHQHSTNVGCFWAFRCQCKLFRLSLPNWSC